MKPPKSREVTLAYLEKTYSERTEVGKDMQKMVAVIAKAQDKYVGYSLAYEEKTTYIDTLLDELGELAVEGVMDGN